MDKATGFDIRAGSVVDPAAVTLPPTHAVDLTAATHSDVASLVV
ncbi:hypothetical protein [Rathayibacter soli]|nr:hypothetical protein [Glaciibacter superstes]